MSNVYYHHLEQLRSMRTSSQPAVSIFIPLKWNESVPSKIYAALLKAANDLIVKDGYSKIEIIPPEWERWMKQGTITLAIFHHNGLSYLIPLPTRMQPRVVVARSFHIKPILTAAQEYLDTLLIHFNQAGANLYRVNSIGETLINCYSPSTILPKADWPKRLDKESLVDFIEFLKLETKAAILPTTRLLGITGTSFNQLKSETIWKSLNLPISVYDDPFHLAVPQNAFSIMRIRLAQMINENHLKSVNSVCNGNSPDEENLSVQNLAPKILNNEIKKLCVSLDSMYFGQIDLKTGKVTMNRTQKDASDDDVLDDLVELAMEKGIEVSVVPKKFLPNGRTFVAS